MAKFINILNYNKSSCIFCFKISNILIYILFTKKLKYFGLKMSLVYGVLAHFEYKIYKDFWTKCFEKLEKKNCQRNYIKSLSARLF